ncbi:RNA-binding protein [Candidatus Binatia bacterium]|jgi:RNA recognition motif-containing protein|nr:RNA-binding protein [Candidatus Binatia bacterium]
MASNTLFVSNFPFTTTEDELRGTFEAMGAIQSVRIIVDRDTGRSRGFAFIEFSDSQALDLAIEQLNETEFRGRRLVVSKARGRDGASPPPPRAAASGGDGTSPFRHRIVIDWSDEAHAYTATIPDLGVSVNGATIEAALRQAQTRARGSAFGSSQA